MPVFSQFGSVWFIYRSYSIPTPYLLQCKLQLKEENLSFNLIKLYSAYFFISIKYSK